MSFVVKNRAKIAIFGNASKKNSLKLAKVTRNVYICNAKRPI